MFEGKKLSRNTEFEVIDYFDEYEQSEDFKIATARYTGKNLRKLEKK